ncbi:MAG TPA: HAD-IA family hydrolase [Sphingobacteriaceae bacterium]
MISYLVFDFDGTLADTQQLFIETYNTIAGRRNYRLIEQGSLSHLKKLSVAERCRYLGVPFYRVPFMGIEFLKEYSKSTTYIQPIAGIKQMLGELKSMGYELAIVSSNNKQNIGRFLAEQNIDEISVIHCSSNILGKASLLKRFLKTLDLRADEVIYIGDEQRDILASREAGVKSIAVTWGYDEVGTLAALSPDHIVHTPGDIAKILSS